jgi:hypothetical protein|tara:strand:- start:159 stop:467 length:309 start_codon:yes stop_codon:yes gene_type:complete
VTQDGQITSELISKLENIQNNNNMPLEKRLIDMAVWFTKNKNAIPKGEVVKRLEFLTKTLDIHLEMVALLADRLQQAEGRRKSTSLWVPNGLDAKGDFTRFG